MAEQRGSLPVGLTVREDQGLVGIVVSENDHQATRFFTDEAEVDDALADTGTQAALQAIGAWADLDWDEAVEELDRIRHESKPSPPLDL
ncbi:MAG: hypothetical protein ACRDJW_13330 [Thermomicrobiales bacterium]